MKVVSQNAPCPCGSGAKFKNCCLPKMMMMGMANGAGGDPRRMAQEKNPEPKKEDVFKVEKDELLQASPEEKFNISEKLFSLNREDEAIEILEMLLYQKDGELNYIDIFFKVIDYYKSQNNAERALLFCDELIKYDEEHKKGRYSDEVLRLKGEILIILERSYEGEEIFKELIRKNHDELWNYYAVANAFFQQNNIEKTKKYIEDGLKVNVKDPEKIKILLKRMLVKISPSEE
jgi:tetratricopeptide (TPR) repeat protein